MLLGQFLINPTQQILNKTMDATSLRNNVIADNIANSDTPGFKRREVLFEEKLRNALVDANLPKDNLLLVRTQRRHLQIGEKNNYDIEPEIVRQTHTTFRNDGNNVDIDYEMAINTKNKLLYDALGHSMNAELGLMRLAITGRS